VNIDSIPEALQSKIRIAIIAALLSGEKTFKELKEISKSTDGNLSIHLSKLEELGYVNVRKEFLSKKPRTTYSVTDFGVEGFREYVNLLEQLLKGSVNG
jgi:DNA-binding HxlR family transcriptional regulator